MNQHAQELHLDPLRRAAAEPDKQEDEEADDGCGEHRHRLRDPDRAASEPDEHGEQERPEEGRHAAVDAGGAVGHGRDATGRRGCLQARGGARPCGTKGSPSRVRFRPPPPLTFRPQPCGFRVLPPVTTSTYSRPVLGANTTLDLDDPGCKGCRTGNGRNLRTSPFSLPMQHFVHSATRVGSPPVESLDTGPKVHRVGCAFVHRPH
jgi:hypothetical protein